MEKAVVLTGDYWHHTDSIEPFAKKVFGEDFSLTVTGSPDEALSLLSEADIFVSFKDPIENDQIPTPVWCSDRFTETLLSEIKNGLGFICCHAALTDLPADYKLITELIGAMFITHPMQCPVKFVPTGKHELLSGVTEFDFPVPDEHYVMELTDDNDALLLGNMTSEHGSQPALWVKEYGKGKVCMLTPAHNTENLTCPEYLKLFDNIVKWCLK